MMATEVEQGAESPGRHDLHRQAVRVYFGRSFSYRFSAPRSMKIGGGCGNTSVRFLVMVDSSVGSCIRVQFDLERPEHLALLLACHARGTESLSSLAQEDKKRTERGLLCQSKFITARGLMCIRRPQW